MTDPLALIAVFAVLLAVAALISAPLRHAHATRDERQQGRREALEAAKDAKYREIRDAELDHRTGKLSDTDWRTLDRQLRTEAVTILRRLDQE